MKRLSKRKCEMWISNNKVLIGGNKKPHARNPNFETEETKLLISLWGDPKVQKTLITTHKKHPVITKLADQMREHGYYRSPDEINTRIKNLKCFYNRIKKDVEMGIIKSPTWKHYAAMEEIVTRPVFGNRVQQPHLQHLLEEAQTNMVELANGSSDAGNDEDSDGLRPEDLLSVKEDVDADMDFDDVALVPKDEPVDIDDMDENTEQCEVDDVDDIFPKLSQYLQLAASKNNSANMNPTPKTQISTPALEIKSSPPSSPDPIQMSAPTAQLLSALSLTPTIVPSVTPATTSTATITATSTPSSNFTTKPIPTTQHSKISLVPTNILLKPQTAPTAMPSLISTPAITTASSSSSVVSPVVSMHPNQPQSISFGGEHYICANTVSNGKSVYTTAQKDGQPMKVLLVNAIQKPPVPMPMPNTGNIMIPNGAVSAMNSLVSLASSQQQPTLGTPTVVSSGGATAVVVTSTMASGPVMPKPKILPPPGVTPPPPIYSTRSTRANAVKQQQQQQQQLTSNGGVPDVMADKSSSASASPNLQSNAATATGVIRQSQINTSPSRRSLLQSSNTFKSQQKSYPSGFRTLLQQLVTLQTDTLEVSRQRLDVERRRLNFEQTLGEKLLNILQTLALKGGQ